MRSVILKWVLKNAYEFDKVNPKFVLGMVLREKSALKKKVPAVLKEIEKTIKEVEKLKKEDIKNKLKKLAPELLKEKKEKKPEGPLKPLPNAKKGKVVVRIAPSPSGPLHIGHAYGASLNYEYAKMYSGKFIVRIEDTNPENIYEPAYQLVEDDAKWLTNNHVDKIVIQSSRLGIYYDHAEKLVAKEKSYVCTCDADEWRKMKSESKACPCRKLNVKENRLRYSKMFNEYSPGEAVLRLKTDIKHKNPAMRDFAIMRINEQIHPKTGKEHRVWPLMILSVAIDDHNLGVTHVLNGKDHADNSAKERIIMEYLEWKPPEYKHWGRINIKREGEVFELSTSKTRIAIEQGEYSGWDDIRLATLMALRKRGYQAGAFRKYATEIGLSLNDKTVSWLEFWKNIDTFNREIIEPKANRYFFVDNPVKIKVEGAPKKQAEINLHPNFPKRGKRKLSVGKEFYVAKSDLNLLKNKKEIHRLMDAFNFKIKKIENNKNIVGEFISENYEYYRNSKNKGAIIHWLPVEKTLNVEVVHPDKDKTIDNGFGENSMKDLKEGDIVQLERRYFARLIEKKKDKLTFWFLHK